MSITNVAIFAFILIISLILSCGAYYLYSDKTHAHKKEVINEILSNIVNFVIFVWVSKILLNIRIFLDDPMAVIVYPSIALSFYIAFVITSLLFLYQIRKKNLDIQMFFTAFAFVFVVGSIINELIQHFWHDNMSSVGYLLVLILVLSVLILLEDKIENHLLMYSLIGIYSIGLLVLSFIYPIVTVFDYIIEPYFIVIFLVLSFLVVFITHKHKAYIGGSS